MNIPVSKSVLPLALYTLLQATVQHHWKDYAIMPKPVSKKFHRFFFSEERKGPVSVFL